MEVPLTDSSLPIPAINQTSFSGGMRDRDYPTLLDENQAALFTDCEIRDSGLCKMRGGRTTKTSGIGGTPQGGVRFRGVNGTEHLVMVNSGRTYYWDGTSMTYTQIGATVFNNTTTNVAFAVLNSVLYISPGNSDNGYSWDGAAAALTDEGNTNADVPRGTLLCQQAGRLCSSGESLASLRSDYISFSDIFDGHTWDRTANNKRTPTDGSEAITAINTYRKEEILVHTAFSTHSWSIAGSSVSAFSRITLDAKVGCVAPRSVVVIGDDAFFLSADLQLRSIKRTVQDLAFGVTNPVTYFVPNLMDRINPNYAHLCAGIFFNNYYLLAAPMDDNEKNSSIIVFDMLHQFPTPSGNAPVCVGEWTNMAVNQFVVSYFGNVARLHYVDANDGTIKQMFDGSTNDDGVEVTPTIKFRSFDYKAPNNPKSAVDGAMQFVNSSGTVTLSYARDDGTFVEVGSYTVGDTSANLPIDLPFNLPADSGIIPIFYTMYGRGASRGWQPQITYTGSSMNLKELTLRAYVDKFITR